MDEVFYVGDSVAFKNLKVIAVNSESGTVTVCHDTGFHVFRTDVLASAIVLVEQDTEEPRP